MCGHSPPQSKSTAPIVSWISASKSISLTCIILECQPRMIIIFSIPYRLYTPALAKLPFLHPFVYQISSSLGNWTLLFVQSFLLGRLNAILRFEAKRVLRHTLLYVFDSLFPHTITTLAACTIKITQHN